MSYAVHQIYIGRALRLRKLLPMILVLAAVHGRTARK